MTGAGGAALLGDRVRGQAVLLLGRHRDGMPDWVLPGGHPRPREGTAACAYRKVLEETGLDVQVGRVAFMLETTDPDGDRRLIEITFLASGTPTRSRRSACGQPRPTLGPLHLLREAMDSNGEARVLRLAP